MVIVGMVGMMITVSMTVMADGDDDGHDEDGAGDCDADDGHGVAEVDN